MEESLHRLTGAAVLFSDITMESRAAPELRKRPANEMKDALEKECSALATFVDEQLADVRRTYDPKVARLAKRRKVMVMNGAFDKL